VCVPPVTTQYASLLLIGVCHACLQGFLKQAMMNYLSLLGWNDGSEKEIYSVEELQEAFTIERITKSPAVFDKVKLSWMNGQHLRALPAEEVLSSQGAVCHGCTLRGHANRWMAPPQELQAIAHGFWSRMRSNCKSAAGMHGHRCMPSREV
jgi:glutamyl/glutaminyl-tRNA synthetase